MQKLSEILGYAPIDIHSHFNHGVLGDVQRDEVQGRYSSSELDFLKGEYDNIGIEWGGFSTYASVLRYDSIVQENDYLREVSLANDYVYQWVVVHPLQEETFLQARRLIGDKKVLGIKLHPYFHKYCIEDYADKIFSFADELGAVVVMHPDKMGSMAGFCNKYPNMKLIIAHLGGQEHVDAVLNAKHGNIYVDTSGRASNANNVVEYAVEHIGADKILFGTDTYSAAFQAGRIALARISDGDKRLILRDNAVEMFPWAFGKKK